MSVFLLIVVGVRGDGCGKGNYSTDVYNVTQNTMLIVYMYDNLTYFDFICTNSIDMAIFFTDAHNLDMATDVSVVNGDCYAQNNTFSTLTWATTPYKFGIQCASITSNCIVNVSQSISCMPNCTNNQCGSDGCFKMCGACSRANDQCINNMCVCTPTCTVGICGSDGCGGQCSCGESQTPNAGNDKTNRDHYLSQQKKRNQTIGLSVMGAVLAILAIGLVVIWVRKHRAASQYDTGELAMIK